LYFSLAYQPWNYAWLGIQIGMSPSQLHSSVKRIIKSQLAVKRGDAVVPNLRNLEEFVVHGLKYVFVPEKGEITRGMPTAYAAPFLMEHFQATSELPPVCRKRVAVVYKSQLRYTCRHCCDLTYLSPSQNKFDRMMQKAKLIHVRLGGTGDITGHFPPKPKGMHWETYWWQEANLPTSSQVQIDY